MGKRLYILYDYRACAGDTDRAAVFETCDSDAKAREAAPDYIYPFAAVACYSYREGKEYLEDRRHEWNYWPEDGFNKFKCHYDRMSTKLIVDDKRSKLNE